MLKLFLPALPLLMVPSIALAGTLEVRIVDATGKPVTDAVVTAKPASGVGRGPIRFPWGTTMTQQNISFNPRVLIVPVGATVSFPNKDKVRHHVYSFSKPARFELKLFSRDETRSYTFTSPGAVALGCNIHDSMSGFIKVVDTPFAAKSNAAGQAQIANLPAGAVTVTVWHPNVRGKDNEQVLQVPMTASGSVDRVVKLNLRAGG
ncbi:cupredoxin domain-containing protein [Sphingobium algorifonticola]|uniref:Methylamine utilization protein n=1 Tax=Sphingobium algorifonticola TaxID=2008318 RepID=A0A437J9B4_9SPHN|nr:methylamine utilization protein [Sphingobium algorifonticola]RVT41980.1 methylamine utilization protein [Sphingobium algorifonticola]